MIVAPKLPQLVLLGEELRLGEALRLPLLPAVDHRWGEAQAVSYDKQGKCLAFRG